MAGITTYADYKAGLLEYTLSCTFAFGNGNTSHQANSFGSTHVRQRLGGAPSASVALSSASAGALMYLPTSNAKTMWITSFEYAFGNGGAGAKNAPSLYDRLVHQGGLVANSTSVQTTNLPTAALPRYTTGEGVQAFIECYSGIGAVNTTATISYTNQAGTAGQTSQPFVVSSSNFGPDALLPVTLAAGDTGVRSVESFTMLASAASGGNLGIVLMKKICSGPVDNGSYHERQGYRTMIFAGGPREVLPGACLDLVVTGNSGATGPYVWAGRIGITER